jgi:hypothetical protein
MKEQWIKLFINFILGGTIVASVSYIGTYMNPVLAAIWWSFPFTIIPSMHFMKQNGKSNKYISKFVLSCTVAFILLLICTFLLSHYLKHDESERIFPAIVKATIGWILCSILFYYISYKYVIQYS